MTQLLNAHVLTQRRTAFARAVMDERRAADKEHQASAGRYRSTIGWWLHDEAKREHSRAESDVTLARNQYFLALLGSSQRGTHYIIALRQLLVHAHGANQITRALEAWEDSLRQDAS